MVFCPEAQGVKQEIEELTDVLSLLTGSLYTQLETFLSWSSHLPFSYALHVSHCVEKAPN